MAAKRALAIGTVLAACGWAAWLFGSVDWAGASRASTPQYAPDTALLSIAESLESREQRLRTYLIEIEKGATSAGRTSAQPARPPASRDIFGGSTRSTPAVSEDGLELIYVDPAGAPKPPKPEFPATRFKLTGVILGQDPRAFVKDTVENKSVSVRIGDRLAEGVVKSIKEREIALEGEFGRAVLKRGE